MGFSRNVSGTAGPEEISGGVFSAMVGRDSVSDHLCRRGKVQKNDPEQVFHIEFFWEVFVLFCFSSWTITRIWDCQGCQKTFVLLYETETETCIALEWQACLRLSVRGPFW
jgi:hypothetical protein